jgi:hypothetical protein
VVKNMGLGFRVTGSGLGFAVKGSGFGNSGIRVRGLGFRV